MAGPVGMLPWEDRVLLPLMASPNRENSIQPLVNMHKNAMSEICSVFVKSQEPRPLDMPSSWQEGHIHGLWLSIPVKRHLGNIESGLWFSYLEDIPVHSANSACLMLFFQVSMLEIMTLSRTQSLAICCVCISGCTCCACGIPRRVPISGVLRQKKRRAIDSYGSLSLSTVSSCPI